MGYVYNGVTIANCQTTQFETVMEKDPSGNDVMWIKYTIKVGGDFDRAVTEPVHTK